jgi:hypothetical protein
MGQLCGHVAGCPQNAYENGIADQQRDTEGEAEDSAQHAGTGGAFPAYDGIGQLESLRGVASRLQAQRRKC